MKQKPEDCAIMAFSNPSGKFMFQVLWKNKAQLFKKKGLPRDPSPNSTVGWISLVHGHPGTWAPPSLALGAGGRLCLAQGLSRPAPWPTETAGLK